MIALGMVLSAGTSPVSSSQELAGLGLLLPRQPSHPIRGHLEEGVCPSLPGRGPALAQPRGCGRGCQAARLCCCPRQARQPSLLASEPTGPGLDTPGSAAGEHGLAERLPAMFNLSGACCALFCFGSHVESSHLA